MSESMKPNAYAAFLSTLQNESMKPNAYAAFLSAQKGIYKLKAFALYNKSLDTDITTDIDLHRKTTNTVTLDCDTSNDTTPRITANVAVDLSRNINLNIKQDVGTERVITNSTTINADLSRQIRDTESIDITANVDTARKTTTTEIVNVDVRRTIISLADVDVITNADVARKIVYHAKIKLDTHRKKYSVIENHADTRISIPHIITDQSSGIQSVNIGIGQGQLSDDVRITIARDYVDINDAVIGQYLDYHYNMRAESTTQRGILQEISCMSDRDETLYKKITYKADTDTPAGEFQKHMKLSKHMNKIAEVLGCSLSMSADNYESTCEINNSGSTYQSLISELVGWTSRLPHMLINAFLRDDTLYIIQRGHEPRTINIDDLKMTMPVISRELLRTEWNNPQQSSSPSDSGSGGSEPNKDKDEGGGDYISEGQGARTEESKSTKYADDGGYTVTTTIRSFGEVSELHGAVMIKSETEKCIAYSAESESSTTIEDGVEVWRGPQRDITETKTKTVHSYGAHGWHTVETTVTVDGILRERRTSASLGSTEGVTPFRERAARDVRTYAINSDDVNNYNSLVDTEFPVAGDYLNTCKNAIKWLNRKTQETVSMSIYDYEHVFDFCDRIQYGGNLYSIQSNNFEKNATVVNRQDLVLIRFY